MNGQNRNYEPYIDMRKIECMLNELVKEAIENRNCDKPLFFSLSMKIDPDGKATIERFSNVRKQTSGYTENFIQKQPVLADVIESAKETTITMELPFILEQDLNVNIFENKIVTSSFKPTRFYKQIVLKEPIIVTESKYVFKNNILEIIAPRKI